MKIFEWVFIIPGKLKKMLHMLLNSIYYEILAISEMRFEKSFKFYLKNQ